MGLRDGNKQSVNGLVVQSLHANLVQPYDVGVPFSNQRSRLRNPNIRNSWKRNLRANQFLLCSKGLPKYHRAVKFVAAYTLVGYLVVMICYLAAWCHPITAYWAVPVSACKAPGSSMMPSQRELRRADNQPQ